MILGLDIGGANTKAAAADGSFAQSIYLPLWKDAPLEEALRGFSTLKPEAVGVVMTGELADCYESKMEGIESIISAAKRAFTCPVHFWGTGGFDPADPRELAAANWSASACLLAEDIGDCLFVDMGSTTTDLIPVKGRPLAATTDFLRLSRGELVYMGLLRTSIGALLPSAEVGLLEVPTCPEIFAITADVYIALGEIPLERYTCDTPDGAGKDRSSALRRLARVVCADLSEIGVEGALEIAVQVRERQLEILKGAIRRQAEKHGLDMVAAAGIGEGLIARASESLGIDVVRLSEKYGGKISDVFPAYAVARLLAKEAVRG